MSTFANHNNGSYSYSGAPSSHYDPPAYSPSNASSPSSTTLRRRVVPAAAASTPPPPPQKKQLRSPRVIKKLDFMHAKVDVNFTVKTERGGRLSVIAYLLISILVLAEIWSHVATNQSTKEHLSVDTSLGKRMRVNLNITFPALACEDLHVDAMDVAGDSQLNVEDTFVKKQLHLDGTLRTRQEMEVELNAHRQEQAEKEALLKEKLPEDYCGPCYGAAEEECCMTCDDVLEAYKKKKWNTNALVYTAEQCVREGRDKQEPKRMTKGQGCNLSGYMTVNRVAGNFHIAMGEGIERDGRHIHTYVPEDTPNFNASHVIHELSFGPQQEEEEAPLNGVQKIVTEQHGTTGLFQYFIKVVPTTYATKPNSVLETNRYFATERFRPLMKKFLEEQVREEDDKVGVHAGGKDHHDHHKVQNSVLPGVFFIYEIYPFCVEISNNYVPFTHLIIRLMATVGGVFTMLSWADKWLYARDRKRGRSRQ